MTPPQTQCRFRIYAHREKSGEVLDTFLIATEESLAIWEPIADRPPLPLPRHALPAVFARYGKPLEVGLDITPLIASDDVDDLPLQIELPTGRQATLQRFRFMPFGWVHPEDYLLWTPASDATVATQEEPLAAPAALISAALTALAKAAQQKSPP